MIGLNPIEPMLKSRRSQGSYSALVKCARRDDDSNSEYASLPLPALNNQETEHRRRNYRVAQSSTGLRRPPFRNQGGGRSVAEQPERSVDSILVQDSCPQVAFPAPRRSKGHSLGSNSPIDGFMRKGSDLVTGKYIVGSATSVFSISELRLRFWPIVATIALGFLVLLPSALAKLGHTTHRYGAHHGNAMACSLCKSRAYFHPAHQV